MEREQLRFAELPEHIQSDLMYGLGDDYWQDRSSWLTSWFKDCLSERGFDASTEVHWSLSSCQGDGVSFTVEAFDATDLTDPEWVKHVLGILGSNKESGTVAGVNVSWPAPVSRLDVRVKQRDNHYVHAYTMDYYLEAYFVLRDPDPESGCAHTSSNDGDGDSYDPVSGMESWTCECGATIGHIEELVDDHPVSKAVRAYFVALAHKFEHDGYTELGDTHPARWWFRGKRFNSAGTVIFAYDDEEDDPDDEFD